MATARLRSIRMQAIAGAWASAGVGADRIVEYLRSGSFGHGRPDVEPYDPAGHKAHIEALLRGRGL